jgi:hypothetical protein
MEIDLNSNQDPSIIYISSYKLKKQFLDPLLWKLQKVTKFYSKLGQAIELEVFLAHLLKVPSHVFFF